jgi:1-aminocyclopropane-1-carboxylate deaminase
MPTLPEPFASIPRHPLLYPHPTPIQPLTRLSQHLSAEIRKEQSVPLRIFIAREDANAGIAGGGGNKVRKLEYVIPDVFAQSEKGQRAVDTLVTEGGVQSNHARQVAGVARTLGLDVGALFLLLFSVCHR